MSDFIEDNLGWIVAAAVAILIFGFISIRQKQEQDKKVFMAECLHDHKQYECDVLWSQTDASKQLRDAAIGVAAGAAIGAVAGRK